MAEPCRAVRYRAVSYITVRYRAVPCGTVRYRTAPCITVPCRAAPCSAPPGGPSLPSSGAAARFQPPGTTRLLPCPPPSPRSSSRSDQRSEPREGPGPAGLLLPPGRGRPPRVGGARPGPAEGR